jgi:hypothetical protein
MDVLERDKYVIYEGLISKDMAKIAEQYLLFQMLNFRNIELCNGPGNVPGAHCQYVDSLMESLLLDAQPKIEKKIGVSLIPVFSYCRVYLPGTILEDHVDSSRAEYSASLTLGWKYTDKPDDFHWSLYGYVDGEKRYLVCEPGDAVIYKGKEIVHGRDRFNVAEGSYHAQVHFHYIDANGPYADTNILSGVGRIHKYDGRPGIGFDFPQFKK